MLTGTTIEKTYKVEFQSGHSDRLVQLNPKTIGVLQAILNSDLFIGRWVTVKTHK